MPAPPRPIPRLADLELELPTERLRLRPLAVTDADALFAHAQHPARPQMRWSSYRDPASTAAYLETLVDALACGTAIGWAIEHAGVLGGGIGLSSIEWEHRRGRVDRAELGYWIAPALGGHGLTTEAARAVLQFAFDTLGLHKVSAGCSPENPASKRVLEKLGFRFVGRVEDDFWRDGRWWANLCFELTATDYSDVSTTLRVDRKPG